MNMSCLNINAKNAAKNFMAFDVDMTKLKDRDVKVYNVEMFCLPIFKITLFLRKVR